MAFNHSQNWQVGFCIESSDWNISSELMTSLNFWNMSSASSSAFLFCFQKEIRIHIFHMKSTVNNFGFIFLNEANGQLKSLSLIKKINQHFIFNPFSNVLCRETLKVICKEKDRTLRKLRWNILGFSCFVFLETSQSLQGFIITSANSWLWYLFQMHFFFNLKRNIKTDLVLIMRLPREAVGAPSLEGLKAWLDGA